MGGPCNAGPGAGPCAMSRIHLESWSRIQSRVGDLRVVRDLLDDFLDDVLGWNGSLQRVFRASSSTRRPPCVSAKHHTPPSRASRLELFARQHRSSHTKSEARLWSALKAGQLGVMFRRQVPADAAFERVRKRAPTLVGSRLGTRML